MTDAVQRAKTVVLCERCETQHVEGAPCAPLQLCPECGQNGGGVPCGHYYDAIEDYDEYLRGSVM